MKLLKRNKGAIVVEFVLVLPLFLILVSIINDISNFIRIKSTLEDLTSSVVNVPFYISKNGQELSPDAFLNTIKVATKAYLVSYKLYNEKKNAPKLTFCWTALNKKGVLWRAWIKDVSGALTFENIDTTNTGIFENYASRVSAAKYSTIMNTNGSKILVLEVFLDVSENVQFINIFRMVKTDTIHTSAFSVPQSENLLPNSIVTTEQQ